MTQTRAITLNALSLYAVALVLAAAFAAQFILHELPCPLCLLQRILFAALAVGPILNIRFGPRPSHYAMSLLAAVAGAVASTRQVLLHIMPGDAGYGSALARLSLLYLGADRLHCRDRPDCRDPAVRPPVRGRQRRTAGHRRRLRANRGVARDRADGSQRGDDAAGMRFRRLRRQSPSSTNCSSTPPRAASVSPARAAPPAAQGPRSSHAGTCFSVSNATSSRAP